MFTGFIVADNVVPVLPKTHCKLFHTNLICLHVSRAISVLINFYSNPRYSFKVNRYIPTYAGR